MTTTVWMDNRPVAVLSNTASPILMSSDISRRLIDGTVVYVPRLQSVGQYHSFFEELTFSTSFARNIQLGGIVRNGGNMYCCS